MHKIKLCSIIFAALFIFCINQGSIADPLSGWFYQQSPVSAYFNDVKFSDANNGIIVGTDGTILKTINGGNNWISINSGTDKDLNTISIASSTEIYIAGDLGIVLKSTDDGNSWLTLNLQLYNNLKVISFKNNTGFAAGDKGTLLRTINSGLNWVGTFSDTSVSFNSISFISDSFIWVIGKKSYPTGEVVVIKSTNLGIEWVMQNQGLNDLYIGQSVCFLDSLNGFCGYCSTLLDAGVMKTSNGGLSWECFDGSIHCCPSSIFFIIRLTGFSVGEGFQSIYKTTNGSSWYQSVAPYFFEDLKSCYFINDLTGWAVGWKILKTTNGGEVLTNLSTTSKEIPSEFSLSQNYPNPFNPSTKIKFDIPKTSLTKLSVYNSEGKQIQSLFNVNLQEGSYEIDFDASSYPSGIYFYRLETNEFTISKKMLLLK